MNRIEFMTGLTLIIIGVYAIKNYILVTLQASAEIYTLLDSFVPPIMFLFALITGLLLIIDSFKKQA